MSGTPCHQPAHERYTLTIEAMHDDVPAANRLRRLLKAMLRGGYGFRCLRVTDGGEDLVVRLAEANLEIRRLRSILERMPANKRLHNGP
jgi:hypothetical protein